jgi:hypothetical protein
MLRVVHLVSRPDIAQAPPNQNRRHVPCASSVLQVLQQILSFLSCSTLETVQEALAPYCRRTGKSPPASVADAIKMAVDMTNAKGARR